MRRAAKVDRNQSEIVQALRDAGASVHPCHSAGQGFPDLAVGFRGKNYLIEVKDGALAPSDRKLTPAQKEWHAAWRGDAVVVTSASEALAAIGLSNWQSIGGLAARLVQEKTRERLAPRAGHATANKGDSR